MSISVVLNPVAAFCIKSTTLQPAVYSTVNNSSPSSLEPKSAQIAVPQGFKIFVNIAWDANVPPPPEGSEDAIQRAMSGEDIDESSPDRWFVPVIVSQGRPEVDKAKKPCLVFDCVFNSTVKPRTLRDPEFKIFLIELALQRIEAQTQLVLSRQIATPNIASKGKLLPRTVSIPAFLANTKTKDGVKEASKAGAVTQFEQGSSHVKKKPLIEELPESTSTNDSPSSKQSLPPRSILKKSSPSTSTTSNQNPSSSLPPTKTPRWSWSKTDDDRLKVHISVPRLEKSLISLSTLDLEPRRLILAIPNHLPLDLNLSLSDAELVARTDGSSSVTANLSSTGSTGSIDGEITALLSLKRQRPFDVEGATAEWLIGEDKLVVSV